MLLNPVLVLYQQYKHLLFGKIHIFKGLPNIENTKIISNTIGSVLIGGPLDESPSFFLFEFFMIRKNTLIPLSVPFFKGITAFGNRFIEDEYTCYLVLEIISHGGNLDEGNKT